MLTNLDAKNAKALFRRAHSYKQKHQLALAVQDLELLVSVDPKNQSAKKELVALKSQMKNESKSKIQEVPQTQPAKTEATETPKEETPAPTEKKEKPKAKKLAQETVEAAAEKAAQEASLRAMQSVPKTAAGFQKDFHQLKKKSEHVYSYLTNIPPATLEQLFKHSEVEFEIFSGALSALAQHGTGDADSSKKTAEFLLAWSKASGFDMTLMFIDENEKKNLKAIHTALQGHSHGALATKLKSVYEL